MKKINSRESLAFRRLFARLIDYLFIMWVINFLVEGFLPFSGLFSFFITVFFEIVSLTLFSTTLGKKIFRLKLNFKDKYYGSIFFISAKRTILVWVFGMGLMIPFFYELSLALAYSKFIDKGETIWDKRCNTYVCDL